jgi:hypothetical protein
LIDGMSSEDDKSNTRMSIVDEESKDSNDENNSSTIDDKDEVDDAMLENENKEAEQQMNARPRRENAGTGIERLEMAFGIKEYMSLSQEQFTMKGVQGIAKEIQCAISEEWLYMAIATNVMLTQMSEYAQMSAKAGIKQFSE